MYRRISKAKPHTSLPKGPSGRTAWVKVLALLLTVTKNTTAKTALLATRMTRMSTPGRIVHSRPAIAFTKRDIGNGSPSRRSSVRATGTHRATPGRRKARCPRGARARRYGLCGDPPHTPDCDARDGEGTGRATGTRVERGENLHRSVLVSKSHGDTNTGSVPITRRVCGSVITLQLVRLFSRRESVR